MRRENRIRIDGQRVDEAVSVRLSLRATNQIANRAIKPGSEENDTKKQKNIEDAIGAHTQIVLSGPSCRVSKKDPRSPSLPSVTAWVRYRGRKNTSKQEDVVDKTEEVHSRR